MQRIYLLTTVAPTNTFFRERLVASCHGSPRATIRLFCLLQESPESRTGTRQTTFSPPPPQAPLHGSGSKWGDPGVGKEEIHEALGPPQRKQTSAPSYYTILIRLPPRHELSESSIWHSCCRRDACSIGTWSQSTSSITRSRCRRSCSFAPEPSTKATSSWREYLRGRGLTYHMRTVSYASHKRKHTIFSINSLRATTHHPYHGSLMSFQLA